QAFVRALAGPLFAELGWRPGQDEPERRGLLRATLLRALGTIGADPEVRARAVELHRGLLQNSCAVDPQLLGALVRVAAAAGGGGHPLRARAGGRRPRLPGRPSPAVGPAHGGPDPGAPRRARRLRPAGGRPSGPPARPRRGRPLSAESRPARPRHLEVFAVEDTSVQVCWDRLPPGAVALEAGGSRVEVEGGGGPGAVSLDGLPPDAALDLTVTAP